MKLRGCGLAALILMTVAGMAAEPPAGGGYAVVKKYPLGGDGSWDYLSIDAAGRRLFIARETRVMVVDLASGKLLQEINNTNGVHGVALVPELKRGFTSNGRDNTVTIFDLKTLAKTGEAKAGPKPDAIVYDPAAKRVFVMNNGGTTATALDAATGKVEGQVELGGAPEFAVADGQGHMYINLEDKSEVVAIDTGKLVLLNRWPLAPGRTPTGLAMDIEHRRLFSGCRGSKTVVVMDADNGKIVASLPIGSGEDAMVFDPGTQTAFSANGDATLTAIHEDAPDKYTVVQNVATQSGARTMALDPTTHQIWLVTAEVKTTPAEAGNRPKRTVVPNSFTVLVVGKP